MITAICCADNQWAIGKNNDLLYNLKSDMKHFRQTTLNSIVVMGLNTLRSFPGGQPLKNRVNIVLCPEGTELPDSVIAYHDFNKLVHDLKILSSIYQIFVIGGAMMYQSMLPYYDQAIITRVDASDSEATAFFPNLDFDNDFIIIDRSQPMTDNGYNIQFITYARQEDKNVN